MPGAPARGAAKAVILAAGRGIRLSPLTDGLPKCLAVSLNGKSLLEAQVETFRACGIDDISVVRGYQAEKIREPGLTYFLNPKYAETNMLESLACAEEKLDGDTMVSYSDIWYDPAVVQRLLAAEQDIALAVDVDWRAHYVGRTDHPVEEAERVLFDRERRVVRIGKTAPGSETAGEFIGVMKLSRQGCEVVRESYHRARLHTAGGPFQSVPLFQQAYLTDLLQEIVDHGVPVHCELIRGGWGEIDTVQDYTRALAAVEHSKEER